MEPLRGGHLAGRLPRDVQAVWDGAEVQRSPVAWSLRWIWNHPAVTTVLSGMGDEAQVDENLRLAEEGVAHSLTQADLRRVDRARAAYERRMKIGCTSCGYCLPCPAGVNIPTCFELYNACHMFDDKRRPKFFYLGWTTGVMGGAPSYASLCTDCGKCEDACPQDLPVRAHLREVTKQFEGLGFRLVKLLARPVLALARWRTRRKAKQAARRRSARR
jgi:hypothetical protein